MCSRPAVEAPGSERSAAAVNRTMGSCLGTGSSRTPRSPVATGRLEQRRPVASDVPVQCLFEEKERDC